MKVWITKYALTKGIREQNTDEDYREGDKRIRTVERGRWSYRLDVGDEVFLTREAAVVAANAARIRKLASLRKQLAKFEKLRFE